MNHTGNLAFIFGFYGNTIAVITHGDHCILQVAAVSAVDHAGQLRMDPIAGQSHLPSYML